MTDEELEKMGYAPVVPTEFEDGFGYQYDHPDLHPKSMPDLYPKPIECLADINRLKAGVEGAKELIASGLFPDSTAIHNLKIFLGEGYGSKNTKIRRYDPDSKPPRAGVIIVDDRDIEK